ncbi:MAG: hypothetical protein VYA34_01065 [Myxococcota bacterium]|nr:hypothetical protein [Myxococcota bacterium]
MGVLSELQNALQELNSINVGHDIEDFLIDSTSREALPGAILGTPEQIFVSQPSSDEMDLAVYIDDSILETLQQHCPSQGLSDANVDAYCVALEGVSHFNLILWRADQDWPISQLELELQAEVDKFVGAGCLLINNGYGPKLAKRIMQKALFENFEWRHGFGEEQLRRYRTATLGAKEFVDSFQLSQYPNEAIPFLTAQARMFYRLSLSEKLRYRYREC